MLRVSASGRTTGARAALLRPVPQKINGSAVEDLEKVPDLSAAADGNELTITFSRNDIGLTVARRVQ